MLISLIFCSVIFQETAALKLAHGEIRVNPNTRELSIDIRVVSDNSEVQVTSMSQRLNTGLRTLAEKKLAVEFTVEKKSVYIYSSKNTLDQVEFEMFKKMAYDGVIMEYKFHGKLNPILGFGKSFQSRWMPVKIVIR